MIPIILAILLAFPMPPLGATLGSSNVQKPHNASVVSEMEITELPAVGLATYYNPGVFETVLRNRGIAPDACADCIGWAALLWPGDMSRTVCVNGYGPLLVVDIAAAHHRAGLIAKNWIVDIDPDSWRELGFPNAPTLTTVTNC